MTFTTTNDALTYIKETRGQWIDEYPLSDYEMMYLYGDDDNDFENVDNVILIKYDDGSCEIEM